MILRVLLASKLRHVLDDAREAFGEVDVMCSIVTEVESMWEHLRSKPCDVVIADRAFFEIEGAAVVDEIKSKSSPETPEVVILMDRSDSGSEAEWLGGGALACVGADLERRALRRTLGALLRRTKRQAVADLIADEESNDGGLSDFASKSPSMRAFLSTARKVTRSASSLLVLGETGVGKEYVARAIHAEGPRGARPFVAINCAALPEALLESELFGHVVGAFTGAHRAKRGYFEMAHGGSLFLDEIGELSPALQVKLLRVLQERVVQPVGAERTITVDIRVIAATNRDLKHEIEAKRFRSDLYYRLGVVTLTVPPLRERREDIPDLVTSHIEHFRHTLGRSVFGIVPAAMDRLMEYSWPGNVRELINVIERAVLLTDDEEIGIADLPEDLRLNDPVQMVLSETGVDFSELVKQPLHVAREELVMSFERRYLDQLLIETRGKIGEAADRARITPRALYDKMKRLGLRKEAYKGEPSSS